MWIIDFEASGLTKNSYPIEVGITNGKTGYQALIKPLDNWTHWSSEAEKIHCISRDYLQAEGVNPERVVLDMNKLLSGQQVYCDSIQWDSFWCSVLFGYCGTSPSFSLLDINELVSKSENILGAFLDCKNRLESSGQFKLHRALDDAKILQESAAFALEARHEV